jgi:hypothetical protein
MDQMHAGKEAIKKTYEMRLQRKEKIRRIESTSQRTVHFIFDSGIPNKITPFTRKYKRLIQGQLQEFEEKEQEMFNNYINNLESESISEEDVYPIIYEDNPFFNLELTGLSRISFGVADDPFFKATRSKYFPEVYLINKKSKIQARISQAKRRSDKYKDAFEFQEDFREQALKVNDDRKVKINLSELMKGSKPGKMILLTVRAESVRPPKAGEFERAWYRLINEDTN